MAALWIALSLLLALLWPLCAYPVSPVHDFGVDRHVLVLICMLVSAMWCGSRVMRIATLKQMLVFLLE